MNALNFKTEMKKIGTALNEQGIKIDATNDSRRLFVVKLQDSGINLDSVEMADKLKEHGVKVSYAIHPVAGRMPGHMNVLLAEANVSYDVLAEPDDVNPTMDVVDVAVVIGANDVVNPSATDEPGSPIYGMPIIEVHNARTVFVLKRSMSSGFAGVQNPLFFKSNTRMLFGDAKESISGLVSEFKD